MEIRLCAFADEAGKLLSEQISALKRNKINLIEIRSVDGINIKDIELGRAAQIADKLKEEGIKVFSIGSPLGKVQITDDFCEEKKNLKHVLELCKIFRCNKIRIFSFFTKEYDKYRDEVIARLKEMVDIAKQENVFLYHENEKGIYGDNAKRAKDLLDNVEGLYSIYDPANYIQVGEDTDNAIKEVLPYAGYLHIKDALYSTGGVVPPGSGDGKIQELLSRIKHDTVLSIEPHLKVFEGYNAIDNHELKGSFIFKSNGEAFDAAVNSLKNILVKLGFKEIGGIWKK